MRIIKLTAISMLMTVAMTITIRANDPEVKLAVENLGYYITAASGPELRDWEIEDFRMIGKREYAIRRNKRVAGKPTTYYRFTIKVEVYATESDAKAREENIAATPPDPQSKNTAPEFDLRYGFRFGKKVYVVSTAVYALVADGTLASVAGKFEEWVIDAIGDPISHVNSASPFFRGSSRAV